jgi:quercetin dioxygenase-like cupin family protein
VQTAPYAAAVKATRIITVSAAAAVAAGALAGSAAGTPAEGEIVRTDLAKGTTEAPISIVTDGKPSTLYVQSLVLKPGASSGWHTHPGPEYSAIAKGAVHLQLAPGCDILTYAAGQAVFVPTGVPHRVINQGPDDAEVVVTYTVPADSTVREDAPLACP